MAKSKTTQVIELTHADLTEAVQDWVEKKLGKGSKVKVSIGTKTVTRGMGMAEHDEHEVEVTATRSM